jgi:hypothetical protein
VVFAVYHMEAFELKAIWSPQKWVDQFERVTRATFSEMG